MEEKVYWAGRLEACECFPWPANVVHTVALLMWIIIFRIGGW